MLSKAVLRQAFRTNLDRIYSDSTGHDHAKLAHDSRALAARVAEFLRTQTGVWAGFEPLGFEPDIRSAIEASKHIRWAFPRVEHETTLGFYEISGRSDLIQNQWGIWEPDPTRAKRVDPNTFHGLLIPGLAFDENGNRLGRGKGYYDRALSEILKVNQPLKIGVALERQIAQQELPHDAHDIAMDLVMTESRSLTRSLKGTPR